MRLDSPATFKAYGLTFESELFLPGLTAGGSDPDIVIRFGTVEQGDGLAAGGAGWIRTRAGETLLSWEGVGRFSIRETEIIVQPAADTDPEVLRQAVLGPVFCLVVQQRGWYPLHASAVLVGESVVAFAGSSGSGKSSLAAALTDAGFPLVADDVTVIDTAAIPLGVRPGITALKLWPDALTHLGKAADELPRLDGSTAKRRLDPYEGEVGAGLRRIYFLHQGNESSIRRVPAPKAVLELLDLCQYRALMRAVVGAVGLIPHAARIAARVPCFRFTRRQPLSGLLETAAELQAHLDSEGHAPRGVSE